MARGGKFHSWTFFAKGYVVYRIRSACVKVLVCRRAIQRLRGQEEGERDQQKVHDCPPSYGAFPYDVFGIFDLPN